MITTRQVAKNDSSAALTARERLLHDPQIRRNHSSAANLSRPPEPPVTVTFVATGTSAALSRREQEQQAIAIARTYKHYYLAEIAYQSSRREVIVLIKPLRDPKANPLLITVDADGNATVEAEREPSRLSFRRLLFIAGILTLTAVIITALVGLY